jgi:hypothetical protein
MFKPESLVYTDVVKGLISIANAALPLLSGLFAIDSGFDGVTAAAYLRTGGEVKGLD